jgi:phosphatidylinositol alpha-mannosyltransferase
MKIALVCPYDMIGHAGGVQQIVMHQAAELQARGHSVKIITPRPFRTQHETPEGYIFLGNSAKLKAGLATAGDVGLEFDGKEIDELLQREKFDVINFHEPWIPHLSRQIIQRSGSAHVSTFHANLMDSAAGKSILNVTSRYWRVILDKTDVFTAVSEAAASGILNQEANNPALKHLRYIPNGIDLKRYQTKPANAVSKPAVKTILFVGRLEGRKGVKHLLKAYAELTSRRQDVQLFIAGKGADEEKLRNYVRDNKISGVTFLGYITDDEKIYHLHRADVFCAPAHRGESFGIVLIEAMAAGVPVVAGDNHGYSSTMRGTGAISLVNPIDTIDFSRRLELMLYDEDLRQLWLKWAKSYVKAFDWAPIITQYEDAYKEAIRLHEEKRNRA